MPRINIEDDIESREEYKKLRKILGGDDDRAMGMLVRFWRLAQKHWAEGDLVPMADIEFAELQPILDSRWGLKRDCGVYAVGSEDRFAWLRQQKELAVSGGLARASAPRDKSGKFLSRPAEDQPPLARDPAETQPKTSRTPAVASVPSPAPVLAPAPALKKEEETPDDFRNQIFDCTKAWGETLATWGIPSEAAKADEVEIGRLIQAKGFESALQALTGARYEEKSEGFNPGKHPTLARFWKQNNFSKFVKFAIAAQAKEVERKAARQAIEDSLQAARKHPGDTEGPPPDPKAVAAILGRFSMKSIPKESA